MTPPPTRQRRHTAPGALPQTPEPTSPSPYPSPSPATGGAPTPSPSSGAGSPDADFVADPGPAFDPKRAPAAPDVDALDENAAGEEQWDEERIREFLVLQGETTHWLLQVSDQDEDTWLHTDRDLRAIAPPLTRILNRYDVTRAAAAAGDEILLVSAVSRYGLRNYSKRRRYLRAVAEQGPQPVTGVPAPEGTGPEHDAEYQRVHLVDPELAEAPPAITPKGAHRR
jgi:hypothetical protein